MRIREDVALPRFNINGVPDDMIDHMAGDVSVVVFSDSYADFAHLNADRCEYLEGVGFAKVMSLGGLGTGRKRRSHPG